MNILDTLIQALPLIQLLRHPSQQPPVQASLPAATYGAALEALLAASLDATCDCPSWDLDYRAHLASCPYHQSMADAVKRWQQKQAVTAQQVNPPASQ